MAPWRLGMVQQGPRLYLVCRYAGYDNERNLALHRILSAHMSTIGFDRPDAGLMLGQHIFPA